MYNQILPTLLPIGLKALAHQVCMTQVRQREDEVRFVMHREAQIDPAGLPKILEKHKNHLIIKQEEQVVLLYRFRNRNKMRARELVEEIEAFLREFLPYRTG